MKNINLVMKIVLAQLLLNPLLAFADLKPLALVYNGPGACKPGCATAAARVANRAGYVVQYVKPGLTDYSIIDQAKVWIQPGGKSVDAANAMGPAMVQKVREFVANGGGYVGFCAGGFISTEKIGESDSLGYGIVPGSTELLIKEGSDHKMLNVTLADGSTRWMYYAGGPFFKTTEDELKAVSGEVIARYPDGSIAGVHAHYGKGKVAVVGFHPEAGFFWKLFKFKYDPDGSDIDFAIDMVNYSTSP